MRFFRRQLAREPEQTIQIPQDCDIPNKDSRDGGGYVWVAVDPETPLFNPFSAVTTGEDMQRMFIVRDSVTEGVYHVFVKAKEVKC